ncbi:glycosyltransferase, partial [Frankia sp. Cppng1_Ct_nod]|uniref:glycosyltransferase n=1 Tax=Frankia sp. Cppng1_Ct_nod TaxID=2897162 RepID=UPI0020251744
MSVGSALDQPGVATDVVIVDDASDDDSASVAVSLAAADSRVGVLTRRANGGPVAAFNDGLAKAQGEYLVRLDADDLLTPGSLARSLALLEANPWVGMAYGRPLHFDGDSELPAAGELVRG